MRRTGARSSSARVHPLRRHRRHRVHRDFQHQRKVRWHPHPNANYSAARGYTGVYAPGVEFTGLLNLGNISATGVATPVLMVDAADVAPLITGGDLGQTNGRPIQLSGLTQLKFVNGGTSHNRALPAQANRGGLEQDGVDVTAELVVNP
jgi:hypothetical protein